MLKDIINKAKDQRTEEKLGRDIDFYSALGQKAMSGFCAHMYAITGKMVHHYWYTEQLWTKEESISYQQDADVYIGDKVIPFEVKVTSFNFDPLITVRAAGIIGLSKSGGRILLATTRNFAVLKCSNVCKLPIIKYEKWNGKKCFQIERDKITWTPFLVPLEIPKIKKYKQKQERYYPYYKR